MRIVSISFLLSVCWRERELSAFPLIFLLVCSDPTFFRLKTLRKDKQPNTKLKYVDIDYPTLIVERLYTVRNQDTLFNLLPEDPSKDDVGEFVSDTYSCLGIDLRNLDLLNKGLEQAGIFKSHSERMPILVVSEVVLAYMEPNESDAVIKFFSGYPEGTGCISVILNALLRTHHFKRLTIFD
jgi:hypothetical protein